MVECTSDSRSGCGISVGGTAMDISYWIVLSNVLNCSVVKTEVGGGGGENSDREVRGVFPWLMVH